MSLQAVPLAPDGRQPDMQLAPQWEVRLLHDAGRGHWWLLDPRTSEAVKAIHPPHGSTWELYHSAEGFAYIESLTEQHWCNPFFKYELFLKNGDFWVVEASTGVGQWLADFFAASQDMSLSIRAGGPKEVRVAIFAKAQGGACVWYSLPALYDAMQLSLQSKASRWIASRMKSWAKLLSRLE